ncbi:MAG: succinate dehydrogenase cytochrome b subunit [Bacteroidales bacterium]|jgi:succinate dehydrogenase / fumarate reductase cytochrome b subunit
MANIFTSSIGKKLIMSITGLFLILFLTLHMSINIISVFSPETFNAACDIMALPIVGIMVPILAAGFIIHIIYASILTIGNLKARGGYKRYAVPNKAATDSWASRNMIILGIIVFGALVLHLTHFWANMQLQDWTGGVIADPNELLYKTFGNVWITILYLLWFTAIWFHLTHGFWSAFQTIGWNNNKWLKRWKVIGVIIVTILMLGFAATAIVACARTNGILPIPDFTTEVINIPAI